MMHTTSIVTQNSQKNRAPRYKIKDKLIVDTKTIGTNLTYRLEADNISRSGILLKTTNNHSIPFIEKTILELTIDPELNWLPLPIKCLASVVRKEIIKKETQSEICIGVRIIQIDNTDIENWEQCLNSLAVNAGKFIKQWVISPTTSPII